ncbi:MAG TPA: ribonuclease H-like YkuK family protein [Bacillota bacterium]|jgi:predicted RNase H-related nuclease YkuK (DUF458 family)|nr:ribonuclease H-like YkuK family protein [Bacillota bacterium]
MRKFVSPTKGRLSQEDLYRDIVAFMEADRKSQYSLIVGTDSQPKSDAAVFVTAIVVHRVGRGARYYYMKTWERASKSIRQRIYYETSLSLQVASDLSHFFSQNGYSELNVEIHCDIGVNGPTKELIKEIVGMIVGSGFSARIKPDSFGASTVADRFTKGGSRKA